MTDDPVSAKLRELAGRDVDDHTAIAPENWDSVDVLDLIAAIDSAHDVTIPVEELTSCRSVGQLRSKIRNAMSS
jgi:acyl carrier protein